jgi:hypothetical protein
MPTTGNPKTAELVVHPNVMGTAVSGSAEIEKIAR